MTPDEIIEAAKEAGLRFDDRWGMCTTGNVQIIKLGQIIAAKQREKDARIAESIEVGANPYDIAKRAAEAIRGQV